jgi:hypothetical protein
MKFLPKCRYIVGIAVEPNIMKLSQQTREAVEGALVHSAFKDAGIEPSRDSLVMIWEEGSKDSSRTIGHVYVRTSTTRTMENAIDLLERGKRFDLAVGTQKVTILLAFGTPAFCQTFAHFIATNDDGVTAKSWGLHYLRQLSNAGAGETFWYDSKRKNQLFKENLARIIDDYQAGLRALME